MCVKRFPELREMLTGKTSSMCCQPFARACCHVEGAEAAERYAGIDVEPRIVVPGTGGQRRGRGLSEPQSVGWSSTPKPVTKTRPTLCELGQSIDRRPEDVGGNISIDVTS